MSTTQILLGFLPWIAFSVVATRVGPGAVGGGALILAALIFLTLPVRPFTEQYARESVPEQPLVWEETAGTRTALTPRDGGRVRWCEDDTFWLWHTVNAHDAKDPVDHVADVVVLDYVQWAGPFGFVPGPGVGSGPVATIRMPVRVPLGLHGT